MIALRRISQTHRGDINEIYTYESEKEGGLDQIYLKSSFKMTKRVSALDISFAKKCSCFILSERRAM